MLEGKALMDKLYKLPSMFKLHMQNKQYSCAKSCYDTARSVLAFLEADEGCMEEFFGRRGERGTYLKEGLFDEEQVQKAYYECIWKGDTYENKRYEPLQGRG